MATCATSCPEPAAHSLHSTALAGRPRMTGDLEIVSLVSRMAESETAGSGGGMTGEAPGSARTSAGTRLREKSLRARTMGAETAVMDERAGSRSGLPPGWEGPGGRRRPPG
jgi:hypothetical protein